MLVAKILAALAATTAVSAHTYIWRVSGTTTGLRNLKNGSEYKGNPIQNVNDSNMRCNVGGNSAVTPRNVSPGQQLYFEYAHNVPGPQDDILDPSHIGPCMIYAARGPQATEWVKLWHDGFSGGQWCTRKMIANRGITYTIPSNMPSGHWVLRVEVLALHSAYTVGEAQFYMACIDINVSGSNSGTPSPIVRFPGVYSPTEAGVQFNVWTGSYPNPPNGQYPIPGGPVGGFSGSSSNNNNGGGQPTIPASNPTTTRANTQQTQAPSTGATSPLYGQCGGIGWTGATRCASGTCKSSGAYYSQCLP